MFTNLLVYSPILAYPLVLRRILSLSVQGSCIAVFMRSLCIIEDYILVYRITKLLFRFVFCSV